MSRLHLSALVSSALSLLLAACAGGDGASSPASSRLVPSAASTTDAATAAPTDEGLYLGQRPPGGSPARFAPKVIRGALHTAPVFMPDGSEIYWSTQVPDIQMVRLREGRWTAPRAISLSSSMTDFRDPFIAPGGDRLFFYSTDPLPGGLSTGKENIWYADRAGDGWGEPQPVGAEVNALRSHWQVSVSSSGSLYLAGAEGDAEVGDIYLSEYRDGHYRTPVKLGTPVNTGELEITPYIAPDGRYLIFARLRDPASAPRLFVSYADGGGGWQEPERIERIPYGLCPIVSPDGAYLFFLSSPQGVSWVTTEVIEELRPD